MIVLNKYTRILTCSVVILIITILVNYIYHLQSTYAQIGLAPVPASQEVLPTYVIDIPAGATSNSQDINYYPREGIYPSWNHHNVVQR